MKNNRNLITFLTILLLLILFCEMNAQLKTLPRAPKSEILQLENVCLIKFLLKMQ